MQRAAGVWRWLERHWLAVFLPPAVFLLAAGVTRQAARAWSSARELTWSRPYQAALEAAGRGDHAAARAQLGAAARAAPEDAEVQLQLAIGYETLGQRAPAVERLERALRRWPPAQLTSRSYLNLVGQYCDLGRFPDADRVLREQVLPRWPETPDGHYYQGLVAFHREKGEAGLREAGGHFAACLGGDPDHLGARYHRALVLARLGNPAEAEWHYRQAWRRNPAYQGIHYGLAAVLRAQGKRSEARRVLAQFQQLQARQQRVRTLKARDGVQPLDRGELFELGSLCLELERPADALDPLLRYTRANPADAHGHRQLAETYRRLKQPDNARVERELAAALAARKGAAG